MVPARHRDRTAGGCGRWEGCGGRGCTAGRARTLYSAEVTAATRREVAVTTLRPAPRTALVLRAPRAGQTRAFMVAEADMFSWVFRWCPGVWRARLFGALDFKMGVCPKIFFFSVSVSRPPSFAQPEPAVAGRFRPRLPTSDSGVRLRTIAPRRPSSLSVRGAHSRLGWPLRAARGPPRATRHRRL